MNVRFRVNFGQGSKGGASSLVEALKDETPSIRTNVKPLSMLGIDTGKLPNTVTAWWAARMREVFKPLDRDPGYRLAAKGRQEAEDERLALLERIFDPLSRRRRELVQPGWRCLEVGAGRGSMAVWLAEQVGESGEVVATDIDVTYLK